MKLFQFLLVSLAYFSNTIKANPTNPRALRTTEKDAVSRQLGPAFPDEDVTFDREYNEEGQPPAGRQVRLDPDHPIDEPADMMHKEMLAGDDVHDHVGDGHRELYHYNCYSYCWWNHWYGWITYCCPYWGCGYYYC